MKLKTLIDVATAAVFTLAGCGTGEDPAPSNQPTSNASGGETAGGGGVGTAALTIAKPDGAITTESHNPYLGDSSASKYAYGKVIFEPLALVNPTGDLGTTPWLAESVEWNEDYTQLTVVPRKGVKWSDGTDFTADDVIFSFDMVRTGKLNDTSAHNIKEVKADGDKVVITFGNSKFTSQARVLHHPIVPKHIWENIADPNTDPLTEEGQAVGTGPYVLSNWSTESVTLTANPEYWGGELAVPELNYVSYGDNAALTTALVSGEADWAQAFLPQIQDSYLAADENNKFLVSPTAGAGTLFMNLQTKPFNNKALREALAWTIDRDAYVDIAREGASEAIWNVSGLGDLLKDEILPEYADKNYSVDVAKAKQILTDAGYTWKDEKLVDPDGEAVSFSISVPAGWSDWNTEQALIAEELKNGLGIDVKVDQPDWGGWDEARQKATFDAIIHWLDGEGAWGVYDSIMGTRWIDKDKNTAQFNFGRYDNPAVDEALAAYATADSDEARLAAMTTIQKAFVKDIPAIPLGAHPLIGLFNERNYTGWPTEDNMYASADPTQAEITMVLQNLKPVS